MRAASSIGCLIRSRPWQSSKDCRLYKVQHQSLFTVSVRSGKCEPYSHCILHLDFAARWTVGPILHQGHEKPPCKMSRASLPLESFLQSEATSLRKINFVLTWPCRVLKLSWARSPVVNELRLSKPEHFLSHHETLILHRTLLSLHLISETLFVSSPSFPPTIRSLIQVTAPTIQEASRARNATTIDLLAVGGYLGLPACKLAFGGRRVTGTGRLCATGGRRVVPPPTGLLLWTCVPPLPLT
jgi:hypothetical protein